ncbi:MAG: acyl-CoA thioesterase [Planctomycetes bacterium]|nr:acyl-CoA thioesterase [Planctomycetota bacterium]
MGVAHHGAYIAWFEEARTEWMRALGHSYRALEDAGTKLPVVDLQVSYRRSVTYDDELLVTTRLLEQRRVAIKLGYEIRRAVDGELVATGSTTLACLDATGRLRALPFQL